MARPTAMDEYFVHQIPELVAVVATYSQHWRESYFFELHRPDAAGDVLFLTMAHYPARGVMDSIQMGRVGGAEILGVQNRLYDGDPHTMEVPGVRIDVVRPFEELRLFTDPAVCPVGIDVTFRARTQPYGLRRGSLRAPDGEVIWDQSHILQSGILSGSYTVGGAHHVVDGWLGQRDHSWGVRDHGRCPMWMWLQLQFDDGFLGVWHWELANGATIYTDGCWAATDGTDPVPLIGFEHDLHWTDATGGPAAYGEHGETVAGLAGTCAFTLEGGRRLTVDAEGHFDRPYEPFHRGGLSQMRVLADDGRRGTAIYEITGSRHHRYLPETVTDAA